MMELLRQAWDLFFHMNEHLNLWAGMLGPWLYVVLFAIIFCETGLVVTPFLPGDSLLFAIGALSASAGSPIDWGTRRTTRSATGSGPRCSTRKARAG
jgi:membrane-associated protein